MADQPITSLPVKTSSGMAATDYLLGIDSAEGYQMLIQDLGDYIIQHATSSLAGSNRTLASAISGLDGAWNSTLISSVASLNEALLNSFSRKSLLVNGTVTYALVGVNATSTIYATKVSNTTADLIIYSLGVTFLGIVRYNFSTSTVEKIYDVKYEIDTVNDKAFKGGRGSSKDPDTYTTIGYYYNNNYNIFITGLAHRTGYLYVLPLHDAPGYVKQIFSPYNSNQMAVRTQYDAGQGATWTDWEIIPTRAEVTDLNNKLGDISVISGQIVGTSPATPVTITLPSQGTYLLITGHVDADVNSLYIINVYTGIYGRRRVTPVIQTQYLRVTAESDFDIVLESDYTHTINYAFLRLTALM